MMRLSRLPSLLRNKFFLSAVSFGIWILFFDKNDFFTQLERRRDLQALEESKQYYTEQIAQERKISEELKSSPATIEKYAREKYLMKRDNEDLFIIHTVGEK